MYNFRSLSFLVLLLGIISCSTSKQYVTDADITYLRANDKVQADDDSVDALISPYREKIDAQMNTVLAQLDQDLRKGKPNSSMGNWFCDALKVMSNKYSKKEVDFALQNYGGLRIPSVSKGPLTKRHIFELMPFDNKLVILEVDGKTVQLIADNMADSGGAPVSEGLSFTIKDDKATNIMVSGSPLDFTKTYVVGLPDYVANGGGDSWYLKEIPQYDTGVFIREVIIEYLEDLKASGTPLKIDNTKRIK